MHAIFTDRQRLSIRMFKWTIVKIYMTSHNCLSHLLIERFLQNKESILVLRNFRQRNRCGMLYNSPRGTILDHCLFPFPPVFHKPLCTGGVRITSRWITRSYTCVVLLTLITSIFAFRRKERISNKGTRKQKYLCIKRKSIDEWLREEQGTFPHQIRVNCRWIVTGGSVKGPQRWCKNVTWI